MAKAKYSASYQLSFIILSYLTFTRLVWCLEERSTNSPDIGSSFGEDLSVDGVRPRISVLDLADATRILPMNTTLIGRIRARQQHVYRARYTSGTDGGSVKLMARLVSGAPSSSTALTVSVRNSVSAYLFTLPMSTASHWGRRGRRNAPTTERMISVSRILCPIVAAEDSTFVTVTGAVTGNASTYYDYELKLAVLDASVWFLSESAANVARVAVAVSDPAVFQYSWPNDQLDAVRVTVESGDNGCQQHSEHIGGGSDGNDLELPGYNGHKEYDEISVDEGACASLAIQDVMCPLTLTMATILSVARSLTFTECGSVVVRREHMPNGFYISVLMHGKGNDNDCYPNQPPRTELHTNSTRAKPVSVSVNAYRAPFAYTIAPVALAVLFVIVGAVAFTKTMYHVGASLKRLQKRSKGGRSWSAPKDETNPSAAQDVGDSAITTDIQNEDSPTVQRMLEEKPSLSQLHPLGSLLSHASVLFTCALIIVAFGLNSVVTDILLEWRTGNMDICYRNDLCSHDAGRVPDLNHVLSNVPYVGAGVGFLFAVIAQRRRYLAAGGGGDPDALYGVPHDFDLFASLGAALLLEGFTSGLYHVCPNNRNSHIDFFFIYYMYAALGAKLWQTRRGVTARFHFTPALVVSTITLLGSLEFVVGRTYGWWLAVVLFHLVASITWSAMMFFHGDVGLFIPWKPSKMVVPHRTRRVAVTHLVLNLALGVTGLAAPGIFSDFSFYALLFFTLNSGVYIVYYMLMKKVRHRERLSVVSFSFMLIGLLVLVPALVLFVFYNPYNTSASAALSRTANAGCFQMGLFDTHDVWHFLSAAALFFIMMGILTLDDDLLKTPRNQIPVF